MAQGVREMMDSSWSIAVSGIAGPGGGSEDKPVGLVYICWMGPAMKEVKRCQFAGDREQVRRQTVKYTLQVLLELTRLA